MRKGTDTTLGSRNFDCLANAVMRSKAKSSAVKRAYSPVRDDPFGHIHKFSHFADVYSYQL